MPVAIPFTVETDGRVPSGQAYPAELGAQYASRKARLLHLNVLGGCCGTDERHVDQTARACPEMFTAGA